MPIFLPSAETIRRIAPAALLALSLLLLPLLGTPSGASGASVKRVDLGAENLERLTPNCGRNFSRDCVAEGKVTIYQSKSRGAAGRTFVAPFTGRMVAWSIALAAVTRKPIESGDETHGAQRPFFDSIFGTPAKARIAVLRQVDKKSKGAPKYRLLRQSPIEVLNPYFGTTVTFALGDPLYVAKGQMVALTVPTWAPALWKPRVCNAAFDSMLDPARCKAMLKKWSSRTSRKPRGDDGCSLGYDPETQAPNEALEKSRPQSAIGSDRRYGCYYGPQAMLYSATIVAPK